MKKLDESIWVIEKDFKMLGADLGNRMTIIKLPSGKLVLHSPVKYNPLLKHEVDNLGEPAYIITPNNFHGLFYNEWCSAYPNAIHISAKLKTEGKYTVLEETLEEEMESVVRVIKINGAPKVNEYAFIHLPSKTLILTDLAFNIGQDVSLWSRVFFRMNGAYNTFTVSRLMKSMISDPESLCRSLDKIKEYDIQRIVVSHGDIVESNAMQKFENAFQAFTTTNKEERVS